MEPQPRPQELDDSEMTNGEDTAFSCSSSIQNCNLANNDEHETACSFTTTTELFDFLSLPIELKRRTAYFLATRDVLHLGQTCRLVHHALVLRRLIPSRTLTVPSTTNTLFRRHEHNHNNNNNEQDEIQQLQQEQSQISPLTLRRVVSRIPVWNRRVHSLTLTVQYQAINVTRRATCLYLSAYNNNSSSSATDGNDNGTHHPNHPDNNDGRRRRRVPLVLSGEDDRGLGRIVGCQNYIGLFWGGATMGPLETWSVNWSPQEEGEVYYLWYAASSIRILHLTLETRLLDDWDRIISRQYTQLARLGVLVVTAAAAAADGTDSGSPMMMMSTAGATTATPSSSTTLDSSPTLFYPQLLLHVARTLRQCPAAMGQQAPLVQFWQQQAGLSLHPRALAAIEEILQADLEERTWRMVEHAEAAVADDVLLPDGRGGDD